MRVPNTTLTASAVAVSALLLLAGCSQSPEGGSDDDLGPLSTYLMALNSGQEWSQENYESEQLRIEELVAECMAKEGFEYTPNTSSGMVSMSSADSDGPQWGTVEFAKQYGYGIIEWPGMDEMPEPEEYVYPNQDYLNSLSESELNAYYETLSGPAPTEEEMRAMEEDGNFEWNPENRGCYGAAEAEVRGSQEEQQGMWGDPEFADLAEAMQKLWEQSLESPEYRALDTEWTSCMAEAGYHDVTTRSEAQSALHEEYNAMQQPEDPEGEWKELDEAQKQAFQEREIAQAVADFTCAADVKYDERATEITNALEQKFVDEHKAELDAVLAKYGSDKQ